MHSSRMRTVRYSGRLSYHACPLHHESPPTFAMHTPHHVHPSPPIPPFTSPPSPPVDRQTFVKHYLSATTVADGKNVSSCDPPVISTVKPVFKDTDIMSFHDII